ncbi:MAG: acetate--CoA ligase family protein, partial [Gammaproteobacteria bacterium]|nr:acetate--CoA ligase family protein [Gammaproteobacteria bacterium]
MTAQRIEAMLRPASVAIVGASDTPGSIGQVLARNLLDGGFQGPVWLVNPNHASVGGVATIADVGALPQPVDLAVIAAPAAAVPAIVRQCGARGVRGAVIVSAGFREGGEAGAALERKSLEEARGNGLRLLGPNSFGLVRPEIGLNAACDAAMPLHGRLALVSQSSALCAATLDWARSRHVGFSTVISTGVEADVSCADILDFLVRDATTDGIMLYLESVGDARRFMSALRAAARVKPVVVMKSGRALESRGGLAFHAGSIVGGDDVFDAAMRRAGVLRIRNLAQLFSAASTLGAGVRMRGRRLGIVTNAGGPGLLAADRAAGRALELAELGSATVGQLRALLPPGTAEGNPVYVRGDASASQFAAAAQLCLRDPQVDALLAILTPFALTDAGAFAAALIETAQAQRKPVFTCWMGGGAVTAARQMFAEGRIPTFPTPEAAVDAIAALALFAASQEQLLQVPAPLAAATAPDLVAARKLLDDALAAGNDWLDPSASKQLLAIFGIPVIRSRTARTAEEAVRIADEIGYPVALKILSPDIAHKTDVGGVRLGRADARSVRDGFENMLRDVAVARPDAR